MGYSKDQLIARLKELQIDFDLYEHPVVLTVEEQAKYVGHLDGALSKNLFLKDKKSRFYIVSALSNTKVDMKILSQRLGLGKGGLRMAPEEALGEILQVPRGCVTPFALVNESARSVSLLLDQGLKTQGHCFFHPLSNDVTISLNARDLDKFLNSIGKPPAYVDLEANPPVGKDQPPDLAAFVPSDATIPPDNLEKTASSVAPEKNHISADIKSKVVTDKPNKPPNGPKNEKSTNAPAVSASFSDPEKFVEEILEKTSRVVLSEIKGEAIKQHGDQLGSVVSNSIRRQLTAELKNIATIFKNTAYTEGFHASNHQQPKRS
ncbi:unnamed protein product [Coffea canephora]|uniref:YbaK/aminoacyl-tRNA synthetase-associated domain-containing protein n=1 Tax=Coffea canephora TaxID=49390 RepID=A0A068VEV0_COFCA|nr:unnamed protein product [Coffea canephora]